MFLYYACEVPLVSLEAVLNITFTYNIYLQCHLQCLCVIGLILELFAKCNQP